MNHLKCWRGVAAVAILVVLARPGDATGAVSTARPAEGASAVAPATRNVGLDPLWDDGRAEYSIYTGTTLRYGEARATEARMIVVKEDLLCDSLVKSESGPRAGRTFEVLKLNVAADFRTGTYDYHQAASVFLDRATLAVRKETMAHHELCGITFVRVSPRRGRWIHEAHSYWEGEADREVPIVWPAGEHTHWDALPVWLRPWVAASVAHRDAPAERRVWLLPSQISGRSPLANTRPVRATLHMRDVGALRVPAGTYRARRVDVITPAGTDRFWFDVVFPHVLLRLETAAGRTLALRKTLRLDYWKHHAEGDERLLR